ncbi:MAG: CBS domain-containing protein [Ketobacteraceae bacterium]|nr:CBS domain-containing protein [Ketobacteraceae bacterium]
MQIHEIMTVDVHTINTSVSLRELRQIFSQVKYHHLLVVEDERLSGVISDRDVLRMSSPSLDSETLSAEDEALLNREAGAFMSTRLVTARPDTLIDTAAILLLENNISCLPVVNDHQGVAGIVTWKDMLKYYVYVR